MACLNLARKIAAMSSTLSLGLNAEKRGTDD